MSRLLLAEVYKVFTTKLWWALLIPVAVIATVIGFAGAAIAGLPAVLEETGTTVPAVALTLPISMKQTTIFAVILGLIGGAGEFRHKTITTSYLTAPSRGAVLAAKTAVYAWLGLGYGMATFVCCALGALVSSGTDSFPTATDTLVIAAAGCAGVMAWCVLGVGIGTLIGNQVAVLIVVLVYLLFVEGLLGLVLRIPPLGLDGVPRYLPGASSTALQTDHGIGAFASTFGDDQYAVRDGVEALVGTAGQLSWWAGGLVIACYATLFVGAGWLAADRRDIT